jgi:hypothetical protein
VVVDHSAAVGRSAAVDRYAAVVPNVRAPNVAEEGRCVVGDRYAFLSGHAQSVVVVDPRAAVNHYAVAARSAPVPNVAVVIHCATVFLSATGVRIARVALEPRRYRSQALEASDAVMARFVRDVPDVLRDPPAKVCYKARSSAVSQPEVVLH